MLFDYCLEWRSEHQFFHDFALVAVKWGLPECFSGFLTII